MGSLTPLQRSSRCILQPRTTGLNSFLVVESRFYILSNRMIAFWIHFQHVSCLLPKENCRFSFFFFDTVRGFAMWEMTFFHKETEKSKQRCVLRFGVASHVFFFFWELVIHIVFLLSIVLCSTTESNLYWNWHRWKPNRLGCDVRIHYHYIRVGSRIFSPSQFQAFRWQYLLPYYLTVVSLILSTKLILRHHFKVLIR